MLQRNDKQVMDRRARQGDPEDDPTSISKNFYAAGAHLHFDRTRLPIGAAQIGAHLKGLPAFPDCRILDVGCGTGQYLEYLAHMGVRDLSGLDISPTGLQECRARMTAAGFPDVQLHEGRAQDLPSRDRSYDAVLIVQALHHFDTGAEIERGSYSGARVALAEAVRVLKPGGLLVVQHCEQVQLDPQHGAYWYYRYFPEAARFMQQRYMEVDRLAEYLSQELALQEVSLEQVAEVRYTSESLNPRGPFDWKWRCGDSMFLYYDKRPEQLSERLDVLGKDIETGRVHQVISEAVSRAEKLKHATFVVGKKPRAVLPGLAQ